MYVSPDLFEAEIHNLFGSTWAYVSHGSEIPAPNDFVTRSIGRRPVIVTRSRDGSVNVVINRCNHRGAVVCREAKGNASRFSCGCHAWTFANDGRCVGVPLKHAYGENFDLSELNLRVARTESYRGFIFASMREDVPPLVEHLAHARQFLDEWLDRGDKLPLVESALVIPPPPSPDSPQAAAELAELHAAEMRTPAAEAEARSDGDTKNASIFAVVLGSRFDLTKLPATAALMALVRAREKDAVDRGKNHFKRQRPYIVDPTFKSCKRNDDPLSSYRADTPRWPSRWERRWRGWCRNGPLRCSPARRATARAGSYANSIFAAT